MCLGHLRFNLIQNTVKCSFNPARLINLVLPNSSTYIFYFFFWLRFFIRGNQSIHQRRQHETIARNTTLKVINIFTSKFRAIIQMREWQVLTLYTYIICIIITPQDTAFLEKKYQPITFYTYERANWENFIDRCIGSSAISNTFS